ncbi:MAG: hypothetical protein ACHQET_01090 [Chitinophagales bacterium]
MGNKLAYRCAIIVGILLIGAALVRAVSINNLYVAINTGDIAKQYAGSILIDWGFSSVLLLLVGIWLLFLSKDLKAWQRRAWSQATLVGLALVIFGGGFWYKYPNSLHLPIFMILGLIVLVPLILYGKNFKK